ncbi:MAG: prepilin peptidase [Candidatus Latescibacteria bacterium]|nr:prepilin peptidase [Candidatus Latescibacterota bacterium]NIM21002.1 prepilin peptidase [Candidatus Latescibacterota bacterium]NIM65137.1 prepilin peptidase [Candidatus Latescibacterota bacterium]NIO01652.1 prepilin peptidase [Candidatus Latescibacterota bacterium]NIO28169.1 prepilin peptidase [Candidatus Latescibacterota bacterium]
MEIVTNSCILIAFIFGISIGSFLNVLIHRLPIGESIVRPRSRCPQCGRYIRWFENVPLLSYILLGGRCRGCRSKIPLRYPAVELLSGVFAVFSLWRYGVTLEALWVYAFLVVLLAIAVIDWRHQIIPDVLSLGGVILGITGAFVCLSIDPIEAFIGTAFGASILIVIALIYKAVRKIDGLGGGDVKLMAMIGAFLGWQMVLLVLFIASLMGSLYGLHLMRSGGDGKTAVAFGSFLAPSAAIVFFFGGRLLELYFGLYPR